MTRDEICTALEKVLTTQGVARAVTHGAFDAFTAEIDSDGCEYEPDELQTAWSWFRTGWDRRERPWPP